MELQARTLDALWMRSCLVTCLLQFAPGLCHAAAEKFAVEDSIETRRITTIEGNPWVRAGNVVALFSPNRRHFVVRTRRGDLERDENIEQVLVWDAALVEKYLARKAPRSPPLPTVLVERRFHEDLSGISNLNWFRDDQVGFIARGEAGTAQAFLANIDGASGAKQITRSATDVVSFATSDQRVLYSARRPSEAPQTSMSLDFASMGVLFGRAQDGVTYPVELFRGSMSNTQFERIRAPAVALMKNPIWISPFGRYAITLTPAVDAPSHWSSYRVWDQEKRGWTQDHAVSDPTSNDLYGRMRYQLVDLDRGTVRPLFDAPDATLSFSSTPHAVFWLKDGQRAIVSHTYLPLLDVAPEERSRRTQNPAIAEVDLQSGAARAIVWEPFATMQDQLAGRQSDGLTAVDWDSSGEVLQVTVQSKEGGRAVSRYVQRDGAWSIADHGEDPRQQVSFIIERKESNSQRPKLYATGGACKCARVLFDPAPELDRFSFGRQQVWNWTDAHGRAWRGGLIYPTGYHRGQRYPLVLQTHGYTEREFLIDGPGAVTTAFAAQPFANAGFMVLQAAENDAAISADGAEARNVADGWKAAIETLDSAGLIDSSRVGIIGWSRTGYHLAGFMAEYPDAVAAATLADSVQYNYTQYLRMGDEWDEFTQMTGGPPAKVGYQQWFERNPVYNMRRSAAALRVEALGPGSLAGLWESYALHALAGRPADLVYFPAGSHVLLKPSERLASQGGNVDWFRFWLQNYEDPAPAKRGQYERWRKLRAAYAATKK